MQDIYSKLKKLRKDKGLTVNQLAEEIGEDYQKVGRIERGKRSLSVDYLMKVTRALEAPLDALLSDNQNQKKEEKLNDSDFSSTILNEIVVLTEEKLGDVCGTQKKAQLISKIYELINRLPKTSQKQFLEPLFDFLKVILVSEETSKN